MRWRSFIIAGLVVVVGLGAALVVPNPPPALAFPGAPWFEPSTVYTENFPDPHVLFREGSYYAYGTATGGSMMPVMTSTDLVTWTARPAYGPAIVQSTCPNGIDPSPGDDSSLNDALLCPPKWAQSIGGHPHMVRQTMAPGVFQISPGQWRAYYAVLKNYGPDTYCISVASATSPLGPFYDNSTGPLKCDPTQVGGVLDPYPFLDDPDGDGVGIPYLIWKTEGVPAGMWGVEPQPTKFFSQQLSADGRSFAGGSAANFLLQTGEPFNPNTWEGTVIENPTLVRYKNQLILGWSGNEWQSANYRFALGTCTSVRGPCTRGAAGWPLLANTVSQWSRAGGNLFVDAQGHLRASYHWWNAPQTTYPECSGCGGGQRRMTTIGLSDFLDVNPDSAFKDDIAWLADSAITTGWPDGTFRPVNPISREAFAAFLFRYSHDEANSSACPGASPFVDVNSSSPFCTAIDWLADSGITTGWPDGTFRPVNPISREAFAAFLFRYSHDGANSSACPGASPFVDVNPSSSFCTAVGWLADSGISAGWPDGTFRPVNSISREAFARFLHRYDALP